MYPELFKIGGLIFYTHGVMAVLGILLGSLILFLLAQKQRLKTDFLFDNIVYSVLVGIIFARITYFIIYHDQFTNFREIFYLWQGGLVSYGGFIFGIITFVLLLKAQKERPEGWMAVASIALPAGLLLGRIGDIFAGEYAGVPTTNRFNLDGFVPIPAYEAILLSLICITLIILYRNATKLFEKYSFVFLVLAYSVGRFIIDFWRQETDIFLGISLGQTVSLVLFLMALVYLISKFIKESRHREKNQNMVIS